MSEDQEVEQTLDLAVADEEQRRWYRLVEAILFASADPVDEAELATRLPEGVDLQAILQVIETDYSERGVNLVQRGKGWAFRTAPDLGPMLRAERPVARKLSRAAIETLSIIAYHQPTTRGEIEEIRGVALSRGTLDALLEAGWIGPRGRRDTPGRPLQWGTTPAFLDHFGLTDLKDLPGIDELKSAGLLDRRPGLTNIAMQQSELEDEPEEEVQLDFLPDAPELDDEGEGA